MIRWIIYYTDGSDYSHEDGPPESAPGSGVAAVVQEDDVVGAEIHMQHDFYCYDEALFGGWYAHDYFGLSQYLALPGFKVIKMGYNMPTAAYRDLLARLRADPRVPSKSSRYNWERPF